MANQHHSGRFSPLLICGWSYADIMFECWFWLRIFHCFPLPCFQFPSSRHTSSASGLRLDHLAGSAVLKGLAASSGAQPTALIPKEIPLWHPSRTQDKPRIPHLLNSATMGWHFFFSFFQEKGETAVYLSRFRTDKCVCLRFTFGLSQNTCKTNDVNIRVVCTLSLVVVWKL